MSEQADDATLSWLQQLATPSSQPAVDPAPPVAVQSKTREYSGSDLKGFLVEGDIGESTILVLDDISIFDAKKKNKGVRLVGIDHESEVARAQVQRETEQYRTRTGRDDNPFDSRDKEHKRLKAAKNRLTQKVGADGRLKPVKKDKKSIAHHGFQRVDLSSKTANSRRILSDVADTPAPQPATDGIPTAEVVRKRTEPEEYDAEGDEGEAAKRAKTSTSADTAPAKKLSLADELLNDLLGE